MKEMQALMNHPQLKMIQTSDRLYYSHLAGAVPPSAYGTPAILAMPTFSTSGATRHGLDLLASADRSLPSIPVMPKASPLLQGSTYKSCSRTASEGGQTNPRPLEFVEMAELPTDDDHPQTPGRPAPAHH